MKSFSQPFSAGLRFKMRYESDDATERRYAPKVTTVSSSSFDGIGKVA
jgi:auxin response factor